MENRLSRTLSILCAITLACCALSAPAAADPATPTDLTEVRPAEEKAPEKTEGTEEQPGELPEGETEQSGEQPEQISGSRPEQPGEQPEQDPEDQPEEAPGEPPEQEPGDGTEGQPEEPNGENAAQAGEQLPEEPAEQPGEGARDRQPEPKDPDETQDPEENAGSREIVITATLKEGGEWSGTVRNTKPATLKLETAKAGRIYLILEAKGTWAAVQRADSMQENPRKELTDPQTDRAVMTWDAAAGVYLVTIGPDEGRLMSRVRVSILNEEEYRDWEDNLTEEKEPTAEEPGPAPEAGQEPDEKETEPAGPAADGPGPEEIPDEQGQTPEGGEPEPETDPDGQEPEGNPDETEPGTEPDGDGTETGENPEGEDPGEEETGETDENIPESENEPERRVTIEITWDTANPVIGDTAHFRAVLEGYEELKYNVQWQYSPDRETWLDLPGETDTAMDIVITEEYNTVYWRILVFVEEEQAE